MSGLKESMEALLELRDEAERAFSDPLGESGVYEYILKEKSLNSGKTVRERDALSPQNCHACPLWESRHADIFYFNPTHAEVLSVIAFPEMSGSLLAPDAEEMYEKQMAVISLSRSKRALVSLLKCPSSSLSAEYADRCRNFLKDDMSRFSPSLMILFGMDLAHYILRTDKPYEEIRAAKKSYKVNGIRTYVTYSQRECIDNPSFKRAVWEDLKAIGRAIG